MLSNFNKQLMYAGIAFAPPDHVRVFVIVWPLCSQVKSEAELWHEGLIQPIASSNFGLSVRNDEMAPLRSLRRQTRIIPR